MDVIVGDGRVCYGAYCRVIGGVINRRVVDGNVGFDVCEWSNGEWDVLIR